MIDSRGATISLLRSLHAASSYNGLIFKRICVTMTDWPAKLRVVKIDNISLIDTNGRMEWNDIYWIDKTNVLIFYARYQAF